MDGSLEWHPLAMLFPIPEGDEWHAFRDSIKATGGNADDPVTYRMVNGRKQGLDGRLREKACVEIGCECHYQKVSMEDDKVAEFIIRKNLRRRHMTPEMRAKIVESLRKDGKTQHQIAKSLGVSQQTISNDLASLPTAGKLPDPPITGKDEKKYPAQRKPRVPGDEKGSGGPHQGKPKVGQKKYDWTKLDAAYGNIVRLVDDLALRAYPEEKKSAEYTECQQCLADLLKCLKHWKSLLK
jgi:hypothetical protein